MRRKHRQKIPQQVVKIFCLLFLVFCLKDFTVQGKDNRPKRIEDGYVYIVEQGVAKITDYKGTGGNLNVPWSLGGVEVIEIAEKAFSGNDSITSVNLPNSIIRVGKEAFSGCKKLVNFRLSSQIEKISEGLFRDCIKLSSIMIPERVVEISRNAFAGCSNLIYVYFGGTKMLSHISPGAFLGTPWFEKQKDEFVIVGNGVLIKYNGNKTKVILPWNVYYVANAFEDHTEIEEVILAEWTKGILENAFRGCSALKSVQFGEWITEIGPYAFENCISLEKLLLPDRIQSIGSNAFAGCQNLYSISSLFNLSNVESGTFENCRSLENIVLSEDLISIGDSAFLNCKSLKFVKYGERLNTIGKFAFSGCKNLLSIQIPDSVTQIDTGAFQESGIQSISLPIGVENIKENVFKGCNQLKEVTFQNLNTVIDDSAFDRKDMILNIPDKLALSEKERHIAGYTLPTPSLFVDKDLSVIKFAQENQLEFRIQPIRTKFYDFLRYPGAVSYTIIFSRIDDRTELIVPSMINGFPVSVIGEAAFQNNSSIQSVVINDTITKIEDWAFSYCPNLKNVIIGNSVESIGADAFHGDFLIQKIFIPPSVNQIGANAFKDCPNLTISGISGSAAEKYGIANGIPFMLELHNIP